MVSLFLGTWSLLSYTGVTSEEGHVPSWVDQGATHPLRGLEVSAFSRNLVRITPERCPLCAGTGVRFPPDYAVQTDEVEFAGWAALGGISDDGSAEIGWYLRPAQWGKGYATDATQLLLQFGFGPLDRTRIIANSDPENLAAHRVLEKAGLRRVADDLTVDTWRGPRPRYLYAISYETWRSSRPHVGRA
jgi:Acetyltransferase (GNAT) domain